MKYRKLRIAFSAACGICCVLLVVLWVRSYYARDMTRGVIISDNHLNHLGITSLRGEVAVAIDDWLGSPHPWIFESVSNPANMVSVFSSVKGKLPLSLLGFRCQFKSNLVVVVLPHWFLAVFIAALAAIPWLPHKRFSLRTMLLAMTALAVLLGLFVWAPRG